MHRRPRLSRRTLPGIALAALALGGCSSAIEVTSAPGADGPGCTAAATKWPATVGGQDSREVVSTATAAHAWGDPAIIARCGVPALGPTEVECIEVDGVGWIPEALSDGTRFTSFGTDPALEILVPKAYAPEPLLLPAFTAAAEELPSNGRLCR